MAECTCEQIHDEFDWNPYCPEHGETAAADRVLAFLTAHFATRGINRNVVLSVGDETLLAADLHELAYRAKSAAELRESQGPAEFEMLGDEYAETDPTPVQQDTECPVAVRQQMAVTETQEWLSIPVLSTVSETADEVVRGLDALAEKRPGLHEAVANRLGMPGGARDKNALNQITKLAEFIMEKVPGEPSRSESAVECAIRVIEEVALPILNEDEAPGSADEVY